MLKLVKFHPRFAYDPGDVFEVDEANTKFLLDNKYAVKASKEESDAARAALETAESKNHRDSEKAGGKK